MKYKPVRKIISPPSLTGFFWKSIKWGKTGHVYDGNIIVAPASSSPPPHFKIRRGHNCFIGADNADHKFGGPLYIFFSQHNNSAEEGKRAPLGPWPYEEQQGRRRNFGARQHFGRQPDRSLGHMDTYRLNMNRMCNSSD